METGTKEMRAELQAMIWPSSKDPKTNQNNLGNHITHRSKNHQRKVTKIHKKKDVQEETREVNSYGLLLE